MNIFKLDTIQQRAKKSKPPVIDIYTTLNDFRKAHEVGGGHAIEIIFSYEKHPTATSTPLSLFHII